MAQTPEKLAQKGSREAGAALSHAKALARVAAKGIEPKSVIDIGAARGAWSISAAKHWPEARFHLVEAKSLWRKDLEDLRRKRTNFSYSLKAVSDAPGVAYFPQGGEPYAGAAFKDKSRDDLVETPATSIDEEARAFALEGPYALKLDTHGTEVDILRGAQHTLEKTLLICIETYAMIGQKRFPEMLLYLQELGFRVADLSEPMFRTSDASLWQLDFYLLRAEHPVFQDFSFAGNS